MSKIKYTLGDHYIMLNYKVQEEQPSSETNKHRLNIPKINIDPKLRLSALSSISDGSSYFRDRINNLEKSIDSNRINLETVKPTEITKLKDYLSKNLENEIKSEDGGNDYILNMMNLFIDNKWNNLIDQLLNYVFKNTTLTGFEMNIPFIIDIYRIGCTNENQTIKSKIYQYLESNNFSSYLSSSVQLLISDFPELNMSNYEPQQGFHGGGNDLAEEMNEQISISNINRSVNIGNSFESNNELPPLQMPESPPQIPAKFQPRRPQAKAPKELSPQYQNKSRTHQSKSFVNSNSSISQIHEQPITTLKNPFISSEDSPLRYIKMDNGLVYIFGILEVGNVSSMADQNQKTLFKLSPDCCPNYKINLFLNEENTSFSSFGRGGNNIVKVVIHTDGRVNYISDDVLNWNSNKIKLYFDGTVIYKK